MKVVLAIVELGLLDLVAVCALFLLPVKPLPGQGFLPLGPIIIIGSMTWLWSVFLAFSVLAP